MAHLHASDGTPRRVVTPAQALFPSSGKRTLERPSSISEGDEALESNGHDHGQGNGVAEEKTGNGMRIDTVSNGPGVFGGGTGTTSAVVAEQEAKRNKRFRFFGEER